MPLAEMQRALARLSTQEDARERLRSDPPGFAAAFALDAAELAALASIGDTRLHAYANSLDRKRANEGARLLPLSARVMGPRFRSEFLRHARRVRLPEGSRRYRADAMAFARSVQRGSRGAEPLERARALLAYESGISGLALYAYDVLELASAAAAGTGLEGVAPCRTIVARFWHGPTLRVRLG